MKMCRATLAIALFLASATVAGAQPPAESVASSLTLGERVRVHSTADSRLLIGGVSAVDNEFLTVIPDGWSAVKIPTREIASIDVSGGRKRNWLKGLVVGLAIGVASGLAFDVDPADCGPDSVYFCSRGEALAAGTIVFGGIGAGIGAFITSERWTPINPSERREAPPKPARTGAGGS